MVWLKAKLLWQKQFLWEEAAYEIYYLREFIEKELEEKNYREVEKALKEYESRKEAVLADSSLIKIKSVNVSYHK